MTKAKKPKHYERALCTNFTKYEKKTQRMRVLAKEIIRSKALLAGQHWESVRLGHLETQAKKLARMVLR